jgi:hypothetical protein
VLVDGTVRSSVDRVSELKLRPPVLVVAHEHHRLSDHRCERPLVFLWEIVHKPRRKSYQDDTVASVRLVIACHGRILTLGPLAD